MAISSFHLHRKDKGLKIYIQILDEYLTVIVTEHKGKNGVFHTGEKSDVWDAKILILSS